MKFCSDRQSLVPPLVQSSIEQPLQKLFSPFESGGHIAEGLASNEHRSGDQDRNEEGNDRPSSHVKKEPREHNS